jgi:hypothetical protein
MEVTQTNNIYTVIIGNVHASGVNLQKVIAVVFAQYKRESFWTIADDQDVLRPEEEQWDAIRRVRNEELTVTDWTQISDNALTESDRKACASYRQALRDMTDNFATPEDVEWPEYPV